MSKTPEEIAYWKKVYPETNGNPPDCLLSEYAPMGKLNNQSTTPKTQKQNIMNDFTYNGYIEFVRRFELTTNGESKPCIEIAMRFDREKTSGRSLNGIVFCISRPEVLENVERLLAEDPGRTRLYQAKVDHKIRPKGAVGEPPAGYFHNGWAWSFTVKDWQE